jgi:hypothetical protein
MVDLRREFSTRDRRYSVDMTLMRCDFLRHIRCVFRGPPAGVVLR